MRTVAALALPFVVIILAAPLTHAQVRRYRSGLLIDTGEYDWCHYDCAPFDRPILFFCLQVDDQILVGRRHADWIWAYDSSKMFAYKGKPVQVRFNQKSIWMIRTDGKDMRLGRGDLLDVFSNPKCTAEVHRSWLSKIGHVTRPQTVPSSAVLIPEGPTSILKSQGPHFWARCSFDVGSNSDICKLWDDKGFGYKTAKYVAPLGKALPDPALVIDPLTTKFDYEIHLKDGFVLHRVQ
jgi:hypothetical protein